jgi:hypothetical protein
LIIRRNLGCVVRHIGRGWFVGRSIGGSRLVGSRFVGSRLVCRGSLVGRSISWCRGVSRSRGVGRSRSVSGSRSVSRGRSISRLAVGRVGSLSSVHNISNISTVGIINLVVDSLGPAIRKGHRVGSAGGITITLLSSIELVTIVVIYSIVVGIDSRCIICWLLVGRVGRCWSIGRSWGISRCWSIAILGAVRYRSTSSQGSQSKSKKSLKVKNQLFFTEKCLLFWIYFFKMEAKFLCYLHVWIAGSDELMSGGGGQACYIARI